MCLLLGVGLSLPWGLGVSGILSASELGWSRFQFPETAVCRRPARCKRLVAKCLGKRGQRLISVDSICRGIAERSVSLGAYIEGGFAPALSAVLWKARGF